MAKKKNKITNGERAMFAFFATTLTGPFFAALIIAALTIGSGVIQKGPPSLVGQPVSFAVAKAGEWALRSYVWAAMPAGLAGAMLAAWISLKGSVPWIGVVVAGVASFGVASLFVPGLLPNHTLPLAFIAAVSSLGVWWVLRRARIIKAE